MKPMKIAHTDGHTDVCYDSSGNYILTSGGDGKVCIWEGRDDTDTTTVSIGTTVFALAFQGGRFFAATDENTIRIHTFPDGVSDGMVTRFTAPSRHFCLCDDGSMLVAGSDDFKIKVMSMEENECVCLYSEHQAPVLSIAIDPTREFIASSSCDGTIKIWNIVDGSTEKTLNILTKCNEPSQAKSLCRMSWSEDGEFLLIPVNNEIHVYLRSSWEVVRKVMSPDITDVINVMLMCPNGKHIAVGCVNGDIGIFEWQNNKLVEKHSHPKHLPITSVAWNPEKWSEMAFCDNVGQLGFLDLKAVSNKDGESVSGNAINGEEATFNDMDDDFLVSASGHAADDVTDIDKFLEDDENSIDIGSIKRSLNPLLDDNDDSASITSSKVGDLKPVAPAVPVMSLPANIFKPTPLQPPFQPGSTPEHLSSRFMVWNSVGIIRQYVSDDENSIDVEFHDTATHHALHIDNKSDFVMGDLSSQAVLLASRGEEDSPSKLVCMHFGSWDSHKEWSYTMEPGEDIQAITVTEHWVAVATESRTIRIFSIGGLQRQIFSLPGNVVALASHGNKLLAVYHKGMGVPGDQYMGVCVMRVKGNTKTSLLNGDTLPLSPGSKLSWIGFSETGTPFYMDVEGVVRVFNPHFGSTWCPVANTRQHVKGKSDHYWLVGISERHQQIRCVPCKGSRYPATLPRPALAVLPFQLPMCDPDSEKSQYEESYQRSYLFAKNLIQSGVEDADELNKPVREALIKLFAFAAKSERDFRALEVCEMMGDQSLLHIAATYATRLKRIQLAERVNDVMHRRQEEVEEEMEDCQQESEDEEQSYSANISSRPQEAESDDDVEVSQETNASVSGPLLKTSVDKDGKSKEKHSGRINPFKVSGLSDKKATKGSQVFDKMEKTTPKSSFIMAPLPISIKKSGKKSGSQPKLAGFKKEEKNLNGSPVSTKQEVLSQYSQVSVKEKSENQPVKKKVSAFDLWYESSKEDLMEEHPDLSDEDLSQKATEAFRALSKDERQSWVLKAKGQESSNSLDSTKKRKLSADDMEEKSVKEDSKKAKTVDVKDKKTPLSQSTNAKLAKFAKND